MTDPTTARPTLVIDQWSIDTKVETRQIWTLPQSTTGDPRLEFNSPASTTEKVRALFRVQDAPIGLMGASKTRRHVIQSVRVQFISRDYSPWRLDRSPMAFGVGVLKNGSAGACTELYNYDFPGWLNELLGSTPYGEKQFREGSPLSAWINTQYPREDQD